MTDAIASLVMDARDELAVALRQSLPDVDDQIIMDHVRQAQANLSAALLIMAAERRAA